MNAPTAITIIRILLVPFIVWCLLEQQFDLAFGALVAAGISDGLDGYLARRFNRTTDFGAHLDAIADKALLVSIYVTLGFLKLMPSWLVILVVSRDLLIIAAVVLCWLLGRPLVMAPHMLSKVNTVAQIVLAVTVLGLMALDVHVARLLQFGYAAVGMLTLASGAVYMSLWMRHMAHGRQEPPA
jgi:cardiolipin synthase (CMP-forming)